MSAPLLQVRDLRVEYPARSRQQSGPICAVDGIAFAVAAGGAVGLIGESGCGKTSVVKALLRLHAPGTKVTGAMQFEGRNLLELSEDEMRAVRWKEIALVPQSAMNSLNPVYTAGTQIAEGILAHTTMSRRDAAARTRELLEMVGVPAHRAGAYPHQLSGGMKQRVCLAMAMALRPKLLICDEPTTALDVVLQDRILAEIERLRAEFGVALLLVSHDIGVVAETCPNVVVLYGGHVAEAGPVQSVFAEPMHPYAMGLVNASITLGGSERAVCIPGEVPDASHPPPGCIFAPRCPFATDLCQEQRPLLVDVAPGHMVACHHTARAADFRERAAREETWLEGVRV